MQSNAQQAEDYKRAQKAIEFIAANFRSQLSLEQIAAHVHVSKYHFDRMFKRWAGVSPIQFQQFLTLEYAKERMAASRNLFGVSVDAGLSGPGRLHDLFVTFEGMTPGEFRKQGAGLEVLHGFSESPFGDCLVATTARGMCHLAFVEEGERSDALRQLRKSWPDALFVENPGAARSVVERIFASGGRSDDRPFVLLVKGTNFQINVWKALLQIREGWLVSYQDVASYLGRPTAVRAVASAIAVNPVGYLIPCHRVVAKTGKIGKYRWGTVRKKAIVGWEASRALAAGTGG